MYTDAICLVFAMFRVFQVRLVFPRNMHRQECARFNMEKLIEFSNNCLDLAAQFQFNNDVPCLT